MIIKWNNAKAAANLQKHGVSFQVAAEALRDPNVFERLDLREDYGEERVIATARLELQILIIVYVEHEDHFRLVSARRANRHEQRDYYRQIGT